MYTASLFNLAELEDLRAAWNELIQSTASTESTTAIDDKDTSLMLHWWAEQPENIPTDVGTWPVYYANQQGEQGDQPFES
jgi:hypothetical protein